MSREATERERRGRVWLLRGLLLVGAPAVFLLLAEGVLRGGGFGYDPAFMVEDEQNASMLRDNHRFAWRFFPKALARTPQPLRVTRRKAPGVFRIVVLGGSAAMGDPQPAFGMPRVLGRLLEDRYPEQSFEIINAAVTAINSHVVLEMAHDLRSLDADAWVVYMGNNEVNGPYGSGSVFAARRPSRPAIRANLTFQRSRLGQAMASLLKRGDGEGVPAQWGGMEMFLEQQVRASDPDLERVYGNFRSNVESLISLAGEAGAKIVLSTVAVNLEDSPPFMSEGEGVDTASIERHLAEEAWEQAEVALRESLLRHGERPAVLHFLLGKVLLKKGDRQAAVRAYQRACDLDTLRFRADSSLNGILRETAKRLGEKVDFVDAEKLLSSTDPNGILGEEIFHEHVHFNFSGNYQLACVLGEALAAALELPEVGGAAWLSELDCAALLGRTAFHQREGVREVQLRLRSAPFTLQWGQEQRARKFNAEWERLGELMTPERAQREVSELAARVAARPSDWVLQQQLALLLGSLNRREEAVKAWQAVTEAVPHDPTNWYQQGAAHNRAHQWQESEAALRQALRWREHHPKAWNSLGIALSRQSRFEASYTCFQEAVKQAPDLAEAYMNWGLVLQNQGNMEEARARFEMAVQADPEHVPSLIQLAQTLTKAQEFQRAAELYETIARRLPADVGAMLNVALARFQIGRRDDALEALKRALELDPEHPTAQQLLRQWRAR